jgi:hypothetical protein
VADVRQEGAQLLGGPDLHLWGGAARWGDHVGHVADQVNHSWYAEADSVVITVRWPSLPQ